MKILDISPYCLEKMVLTMGSTLQGAGNVVTFLGGVVIALRFRGSRFVSGCYSSLSKEKLSRNSRAYLLTSSDCPNININQRDHIFFQYQMDLS